MIARDEERNLPKSLGPLMEIVDEAVFLDTGSKDQSLNLAQKAGARVFQMVWPHDFAAARNVALGHIKADYVLWLDADNSLEPEELKTFKNKLTKEPVIWLATERVIPQGDEIWQKRFFPNQPDCFWSGAIHEQLLHPAHYPVRHSQLVINHWGYQDPKLAKLKGQRNLDLLLAKSPEEADFYHLYQTGRTLLNLRRAEEAWVYLTMALKKATRERENNQTFNFSLYAHTIILLAQIEKAQGRWAAAEKNLLLLTQTDPNYGPGYYYLGRLWSETAPAKALGAYSRALELGLSDPGWGANGRKLGYTAAISLGHLWRDQGEFTEAEKAYQKALSLDPSRPEPRLELASLAYAAGRKNEAQMASREVLKLFPGLRAAQRLLESFSQVGGAE
jgi:tetratricopeptide (TPR) repeat protein